MPRFLVALLFSCCLCLSGAAAFLQAKPRERSIRGISSRRRFSSVLAGQRQGTSLAPPQKVAIVGGGPAGLLLAHYILDKTDNSVAVSIFERGPDPRKDDSISGRQYSLGLNVRGRAAISGIEDLWKAVAKEGLESDNFLLHVFGRKFRLRSQKADVPPSLLIGRKALCKALATELVRKYGQRGGRLDLSFDSAPSSVDLGNGVLYLSKGKFAVADLIVGADGMNSIVREAIVEAVEKQEKKTEATGEEEPDTEQRVREAMRFSSKETGKVLSEFRRETSTLSGRWRVLHDNMPTSLDADAVHLLTGTLGQGREKEGKKKTPVSGGLFVIPARDGTCSVLVNWRESNPPVELLSSTPSEFCDIIETGFKAFGRPSEEAAKRVLSQRNQFAQVVYCSSMMAPQAVGTAVLIGDAAHATGGSQGQGANSAALDCMAFGELLDKFRAEGLHGSGKGLDFQRLASEFSARQTKEGHALLQLLQVESLPFPWSILFFFREAFRSVISKVPVLGKAVFGRDAALWGSSKQLKMSQSLVPYSEIAESYRFWIRRALERRGSQAPSGLKQTL
uniref:FAD-binding domain-containing protein n=1 Tax=Chromera velia CCMP2878 TaxID=1169474 RepID=A0A0G4HWW1_9ALVE|eukprot:Cvel_1471.t1-p1 / transcript=Cvel_1471.t1 / gene=Cvel_1471 / organism=Chromera_velia_CCMP2878 / gene_product=Kynurenine 3-monooxygenase, putative / transcript_product=Kynurenine 3-monooxygenase, putative / location=Cvel_scaffold51:140301-143919(-) / protein_length=563 / sequence_SO=supercontig / SO=protein_coding / is_pseudo=false